MKHPWHTLRPGQNTVLDINLAHIALMKVWKVNFVVLLSGAIYLNLSLSLSLSLSISLSLPLSLLLPCLLKRSDMSTLKCLTLTWNASVYASACVPLSQVGHELPEFSFRGTEAQGRLNRHWGKFTQQGIPDTVRLQRCSAPITSTIKSS